LHRTLHTHQLIEEAPISTIEFEKQRRQQAMQLRQQAVLQLCMQAAVTAVHAAATAV
jgi:hypothetical protein